MHTRAWLLLCVQAAATCKRHHACTAQGKTARVCLCVCVCVCMCESEPYMGIVKRRLTGPISCRTVGPKGLSSVSLALNTDSLPPAIRLNFHLCHTHTHTHTQTTGHIVKPAITPVFTHRASLPWRTTCVCSPVRVGARWFLANACSTPRMDFDS